MNKIYFDDRWIGDHGIGRFADALQQRLDLQALRLKGSPSSPFDPVRMLAKTWRLPSRAVAFSPGYNAPLVVVRPYVFTMHDLNHLDVPANSSVAKRLYYRIVLKRACRKASRVLTVSEFSRDRIIDWSGVSPEKVTNVSNGVDSHYRPHGDKYDTDFTYLLSVGNRKPHKNERRLVEAFARARINQEIRLLFTGEPTDELQSAIRHLNLSSRVSFAGRVAEDRMPSLYRGALGLLFPSLYEGFGLPVLEAMACGIPVLTSNVTSLPEIAGDAALLVDPLDVDAISRKIEQLVDDVLLREKLRTKGLKRANMFSWDYVASRVKEVLEEVAK
ncbi:glycosyltransferase family 4 protein [Desulfovermiculus halophilus]|uniref:glycosyltransferase family 4 protein n=1 Tax=Desulfovermiculus halophilus TaxID=339722 RepID=UPI000482CCC4|nr:glycosyltransferase family 1 protein [Desulfovermiculus halophilus]